jgi:putative spermidine/putrescine transport system permease protein
MTATAVREDRAVSGGARVSAALWRRAWLRATLTLSPPLAWFLVIYLASLLVMLVTAFWSVNPFTNSLVHSWTLANFQQIFTPTYLTIIARTVIMAAVVTVTDAVLALPFAYFMAGGRRCSSPCCSRCGRATWPGSTPGSSSCRRAAR